MKAKYSIYIKIGLCLIGAAVLFILLTNRSEEPLSFLKREEVIHEKLEAGVRNSIAVLIMSGNYEGIKHENVILSCTGEWQITQGNKLIEHRANDEVSISDLDIAVGDTITVSGKNAADKIEILSIIRKQKKPAYRGSFRITREEDGYVVINDLLMEEYLFGVVPSEMPSDYPMEALKAQAVCARTYACRYFDAPAYEEYDAHVDDSSGYQVYNNIAEQTTTTQAVLETNGVIMTYQGQIADAYYYSTSCGYSTVPLIWKTDAMTDCSYLTSSHISFDNSNSTDFDLMDNDGFKQYISNVYEQDLEANEPWYRWTYTNKSIDMERMQMKMQERYAKRSDLILTENLEDRTYESKEIGKLGKLKDMYVVKRLPGGVIDELLVVAENCTILIIGEYNVRYCLADEETEVVRQDRSKQIMPTLLPSAFFSIDLKKDKKGYISSYTLTGGGFGHGVGMSQNGARCAATEGYDWEEILHLFYGNLKIERYDYMNQ